MEPITVIFRAVPPNPGALPDEEDYTGDGKPIRFEVTCGDHDAEISRRIFMVIMDLIGMQR